MGVDRAPPSPQLPYNRHPFPPRSRGNCWEWTALGAILNPAVSPHSHRRLPRMPAGPPEAARQVPRMNPRLRLREAVVTRLPNSLWRPAARITLAAVMVAWLTLPGRSEDKPRDQAIADIEKQLAELGKQLAELKKTPAPAPTFSPDGSVPQ